MEDFEERSNEESLNISRYWDVLCRRRWYFIAPLFVGWLAVWAVSWILPSVFRSGTLILVEQPTVPQTLVPSNISGDLQSRLNTITQQILSRTRLLHIVETLDLYPELRKRKTADEVIERMRKDIEIELVRSPDRDLSSFNIYYSASNPYVAQQVTSELTNLFISENLEGRQRQAEHTTQFFEKQLEEARKALASQEDAVRQFKDRHLGELPGQLQSNLQILGGLQTQLQSEQDSLDRAKQQEVYLQSLLGEYRSMQRSVKVGDDTPAGLPALEQELDRLKTQLADLTSRYTPNHPDVRKLKEQIARTERMKEQIAADLRTSASGTGGSAPVLPQSDTIGSAPMAQLQSQLKANQIEVANRQHSVEELKAKIGEYQMRLNRAPVMEQQLADLTRGYDQSRANYDSLLAKKNNSELATDLERTQQGEHFRILDPPSLPQKPYSPNRLKLCGLGLFVGLVLGVAGVVGREFSDDRIHGEEELKKLLPVDIITGLPEIVTEEERVKHRERLRLEWLMAAVMLVSLLMGSAFSYFRG